MNEMGKKFKGVVFDLDGTLMYTLDDILIAMNYALTSRLFDINVLRVIMKNG